MKQLLVEMTTKAGQKCTAIRRAIVPTGTVDALVQAVADKIAERVVIGDPHAESVTMGPLVSTEQRDDVLAQVGKLLDGGGTLLMGSTDAPDVVLADGSTGKAPEGAFVAPMLIGFDDTSADAVHEVEAFGPVSSVLTYDTLAEAADLVGRGGGSSSRASSRTTPRRRWNC